MPQVSLTQQAPGSTPTAPTIAPMLMASGLLLSLPCIVLLSIAAYRQHQRSRLQRQISRLERLWRLDSSEKTR